MKTLPESIVEHSRRLPEGGLLSAKEFLHLGSRAAVDQALSRLAKAGRLIRATRGLYLAAITDQGRYLAPAIDKVVSALASKNQEEIVLDGARSANMLGLSAQVPRGDAFLTNGRARTLQVGEVTAEIRHAPLWMLALGSTTAGAVIRALAWLGERRIGGVMEALRKQLAPSDWHALSSVRSILPSWMALAIGREVG
ncbi:MULTISPECIES: DUF6088 family protein [Pseudomonas]|uniref:DUF6088 family protein n=1 Tax=Pseudomonas TaxID=286 RepID=UPI00087705EA|nr:MULTISPECIES: DUF6088 family protein [Pseudomonas]SCZ35560.1 Transcriptional regulator, AbiEi antitoxin, Type IV TA system [Pseudomonas sp. NFIX46]SDB39272.1 Transcriptional regulator, AbiEi antitoxin, Type IV TA system [Pseudomonas putida]SFQ90444.1 Transcriptional regulator, AbiEi antitoxin, Type IV TA system [Pseudomonas sp. NFIX49]